jgi:hypothetical protein
VNGLWSDGWRAQTQGDAATGPAIWKGFLYVGPQAARWTTLRIVTPVDARLYYVPFVLWAPPGGQPQGRLDPQNVFAGRRAVAVESCGRQPLGYTGGITTMGRACVTLTVEAAGRRAERVVLPLGAPC